MNKFPSYVDKFVAYTMMIVMYGACGSIVILALYDLMAIVDILFPGWGILWLFSGGVMALLVWKYPVHTPIKMNARGNRY